METELVESVSAGADTSVQHEPKIMMSDELMRTAPHIRVDLERVLKETPSTKIKVRYSRKHTYTTACTECSRHHIISPTTEIKYDCEQCNQIHNNIQNGYLDHFIFNTSVKCIIINTDMSKKSIEDGQIDKTVADVFRKHLYESNDMVKRDVSFKHYESEFATMTVATECPFCSGWTVHDKSIFPTSCGVCKQTWNYKFVMTIFCDVCNDNFINLHEEYMHCTTCAFDSCIKCIESSATKEHCHPVIKITRATKNRHAIPKDCSRVPYVKSVDKT